LRADAAFPRGAFRFLVPGHPGFAAFLLRLLLLFAFAFISASPPVTVLVCDLRSRFAPELFQKVGHVVLHGSKRHIQLVGNFLVSQSCLDLLKHSYFSCCKPCVFWIYGCRIVQLDGKRNFQNQYPVLEAGSDPSHCSYGETSASAAGMLIRTVATV
jgi:hypothetical protein